MHIPRSWTSLTAGGGGYHGSWFMVKVGGGRCYPVLSYVVVIRM